MKKKNFISEQEVKGLVEKGKYDNYDYFIVPIPSQVDPKYTEQFQDFVKKVKEELLRQGKLSNAKKIEDIYYEFIYTKKTQLLALVSYETYFEKNRTGAREITEQVYIPSYLLDKDFTDAELNEWTERMGKAIGKKYDGGLVSKIKIDNDIAIFTIQAFDLNNK